MRDTLRQMEREFLASYRPHLRVRTVMFWDEPDRGLDEQGFYIEIANSKFGHIKISPLSGGQRPMRVTEKPLP